MKNKSIVLIENTGRDFYISRLRYALHLKSLGNLVYAIIPDDGYFEQINSHGINVILVSNNIRGSGILNKIIYGIDLIRIFKNIKFDIIHTYRLQPNIIGTIVSGTITKSKIVNHITGLGTAFNYYTPKYKLMQLVTKILYRFNNLLFKPVSVFQNHDDIKDLGLKNKLFCVKGSAVNEDRFSYDSISIDKIDTLNKQYNLLQDDIINFLFVSRLLKEKGIVELIEGIKLASKNNNIQLLIVGWFDDNNKSSLNQNSLNDLIKGFDNIKFLGKQKNIPEIISLTDVSILPTYYREGTPRFLLESMAMKKPIITTKMPGCDHLIHNNENGILIEPRSVDAIEKSINLICDKELTTMGEASYKLYKSKFSEKVVYSSLIDIYKKL
ncbi:glycosyltransferase, GT1 family [Formosa sp. Hel3_A1_48]|uniref:glycosyltransferase n=1 Tax=Formosa sp. Hel3_A1_48 TaxID=1336795 RepID=UPI00084E20E6|nr:glycosyltransferase [Formosa sp. Hel3_A1_48]AOR26759.1 glycosyltransferase, GT1 family [Formosa sp. Hel3_A1_48]